MKFTRRMGMAAGCLFVLLMAHGVVEAESPELLGSQERPVDVTVQLKWKHQFQFAGYYAAKQQGYYREAGLNVTFVEASEERDPADVVLDGDADFGIATSDLILLRSKGRPVVALAAIFQHSPLILLVRSGTGITHVHDLPGKRVMMEPHAAELLAYLKYESISPGSLEMIAHSFNPAALIAGEVDAISGYSTDEPFLLQQAGVPYLTFNPRAGGIDFYGDTLFTTEAMIKRHPARVRAFVDASLKGWRYALQHPDAIIDLILSEYSQRHSREHLQFEAGWTHRLILPEVVEVGYMNPGRWRHIAEVYADLGMMPQGVSLDGFLYAIDSSPDLRWLYLSLAAAVLVAAGVGFVAMRFYRLNRLIVQEIDDRRQVEASLLALQERYQVLVEHAPFPIFISDLSDGVVRYVNPAAAKLFSIDQAQVVGRSSVEFYVDREDRDRLLAILDRQGFVQHHEVRMRTAADRVFWSSISATVISFEDRQSVFLAMLDVTERKRLEDKLKVLATTDEMTGLWNRRHFLEVGAREFERARRYHTPLSLLVLDADLFKRVNDTYGHGAGDAVLKRIATVIRATLREVDTPGRLGGEEFGILAPSTDLENGTRLAERVRAAIRASPVVYEGVELRVTVSIGVAAHCSDCKNLDDLIRVADRALYDAKEQGRDRVVSRTS